LYACDLELGPVTHKVGQFMPTTHKVDQFMPATHKIGQFMPVDHVYQFAECRVVFTSF